MNIINTVRPYLSKQHILTLAKSITNRYHQKPACPYSYRPTIYMKNPIFQLIFGACQPKLKLNYKRDKIYQQDGGHITLDWYTDKNYQKLNPDADICLIMHGLTGGSEMNYIKYLLKQARKHAFRGVCFNSRGISNQMSSPMPFTGITYEELDTAIAHIKQLYSKANIYLVGASFGGNYILRYLLRHPYSQNIKGVVCLASPFNVNKVVQHMNPTYQKFFIKRYIRYTVDRHPIMKSWEEQKVISFQKVYGSNNLFEYHSNLTVPIVKYPSVQALFDTYKIGDQIANLQVPALLMLSKDDPIVSIQDVPFEAMEKNPLIKTIQTDEGSHCCWFQGMIPRRWYPKPTFDFFNKIRNSVQDNQ